MVCLHGPLYLLPGQYHDQQTGLYYNWHRYYDPTIGRYYQADPIGIAGGTNQYGYANQNPIQYIDPNGLTWRSNFEFVMDWLFERGESERVYGQNDIETQELMNSPAGNFMRNLFASKNCQNITNGSYGSMRAYREVGWRLPNTSAQVGGFLFSASNNENGTVSYTVNNTAGRTSFFRSLTLPINEAAQWLGFTNVLLAVPNVERGTGGLFISTPFVGIGPWRVPSLAGNIQQTFQWTEPAPCGCK